MNRHFRDVFRARRYAVTYGEFNGVHHVVRVAASAATIASSIRGTTTWYTRCTRPLVATS